MATHAAPAAGFLGNGLSDPELPEWLVPYAERFYRRYPEVFLALGDPSLPQHFHLPSQPRAGFPAEACFGAESRSSVEFRQQASAGTTLRVFLSRRQEQPTSPTRQPEGILPQAPNLSAGFLAPSVLSPILSPSAVQTPWTAPLSAAQTPWTALPFSLQQPLTRQSQTQTPPLPQPPPMATSLLQPTWGASGTDVGATTVHGGAVGAVASNAAVASAAAPASAPVTAAASAPAPMTAPTAVFSTVTPPVSSHRGFGAAPAQRLPGQVRVKEVSPPRSSSPIGSGIGSASSGSVPRTSTRHPHPWDQHRSEEDVRGRTRSKPNPPPTVAAATATRAQADTKAAPAISEPPAISAAAAAAATATAAPAPLTFAPPNRNASAPDLSTAAAQPSQAASSTLSKVTSRAAAASSAALAAALGPQPAAPDEAASGKAATAAASADDIVIRKSESAPSVFFPRGTSGGVAGGGADGDGDGVETPTRKQLRLPIQLPESPVSGQTSGLGTNDSPSSFSPTMSSSLSLRRKVSLVLDGDKKAVERNKKKTDPLRFLAEGVLSMSPNAPENMQKVVALPSPCASDLHGASRMLGPRPLPGAFAYRRSLIVFDWDDTLCPTTWIRHILKGTLADLEEWLTPGVDSDFIPGVQGQVEKDWYQRFPPWFHHPLPDLPWIAEQIEEIESAVMRLLNVAQAFGVVCIVTNAVPGWVDETIAKWLPRLRPYVQGHGTRPRIHVLYGQRALLEKKSQESLKFADELGVHMWWKKAAMSIALDGTEHLYRLGEAEPAHSSSSSTSSWLAATGAKPVTQIISMGDSEAEMVAVDIASAQFTDIRAGRCAAAARKARGAASPRASTPAGSSPDSRYSSPEDGRGRSPSHDDFSSTTPPSQTQASGGSRLNSPNMGALRTPSARRGRRSTVDLSERRMAGTATSAPAKCHFGVGNRPWSKKVKFADAPQARQLQNQLRICAEVLPRLAGVHGSCRIDLSTAFDKDEVASPVLGTRSARIHHQLGEVEKAAMVSANLERRLAVQTV